MDVITADVIKISVRERCDGQISSPVAHKQSVRPQSNHEAITSGVCAAKGDVLLNFASRQLRFPLPPLGDQAQIVKAVSRTALEEIDRAEARSTSPAFEGHTSPILDTPFGILRQARKSEPT